MDGWRVLDFSAFEGRIRYERGQLRVLRDSGEELQVPLVDVAIMLIGLKVSVGRALLHQLAEFDVTVLLCDWRGIPIGAMNPWSSHTRVGARHLAQMELTVPRRKNAWGRIIKAKVKGQAAVLGNVSSKHQQHLITLSKSVKSGDPQNIEALAARYYWPRIFDDESFSRYPGLGSGRNGLLDYGYTVLRGYAIRAVLSAGLIPAVGIFHRGRSNYFNLADDLIEPFRPAIDDCVSKLPLDSSPAHPSVKVRLVAAANRTFSSTGATVPTEMLSLAQQFGRYVENEIDRLPVPTWDGPQTGESDED